ncbi:MAG TPA: DnaJ domain-containing protein, partial [Chloroflexota bacterium]|nr:DnaJ domain-containing protein [Chloroflexota bacterium]
MFYHSSIASKLNAPTELDLYAVLELQPGASADEIRRQYKRLAKAFHPDLNRAPEASTRMKALNEAYAVLGDPTRRAIYDSLSGVRWGTEAEEGPAGRGLRRFEHDLDNEMPIAEVLGRKRAARELLVRKTDYRLYHVSS